MKNPDTESCRVMVKGPRCQALVAWRSFVLDNPFHRTNFSWVFTRGKGHHQSRNSLNIARNKHAGRERDHMLLPTRAGFAALPPDVREGPGLSGKNSSLLGRLRLQVRGEAPERK